MMKRCFGRNVTDETRKKISTSKAGVANHKVSEKLKGRVLSKQHREQIANGMKVSKLHELANEKRSKSLKGRVPFNKGEVLSESHRLNIGKGLKGNTNAKGKKYGHQKCGLCGAQGHKRSTCEKDEK